MLPIAKHPGNFRFYGSRQTFLSLCRRMKRRVGWHQVWIEEAGRIDPTVVQKQAADVGIGDVGAAGSNRPAQPAVQAYGIFGDPRRPDRWKHAEQQDFRLRQMAVDLVQDDLDPGPGLFGIRMDMAEVVRADQQNHGAWCDPVQLAVTEAPEQVARAVTLEAEVDRMTIPIENAAILVRTSARVADRRAPSSG